jgi:hypothetical protein
MATSAPIYKWVDENGVTHFSEQKSGTQPAERVEVIQPPINTVTDDGGSSANRMNKMAEELRHIRANEEDDRPFTKLPDA